MKISNPWKKDDTNRTSKQKQATTAGEYTKSVLKNATLPLAKAVKKGNAAVKFSWQNADSASGETLPVAIATPVIWAGAAVVGATVGTASALKRAYKGAKNLKENEALKGLGTKAQNAPSKVKKAAGEGFTKMREGVRSVTADIPNAISSAFANINLS